MAQAKQSYFRKTHHANRYEKKKHFDDNVPEKIFFASGYARDQPKKVYQRALNENQTDYLNLKNGTNSIKREELEDQSTIHTNAITQSSSKPIQEKVFDENYYPKDYKNRKYSRDSANDSTSNDEAHYSPINAHKTKEDNFKIKYKTELCKYFEINGRCKFGDNCAYAHGKENLRSKVTNSTAYRTRKCKQFFENGFCPYGNRCQFAHALKSNIINNPYDKNMSYIRTMKMLSKKENVGNIKALLAKPRLPFFQTIAKDNCKSTLLDDIKNVTEEYKRIDE